VTAPSTGYPARPISGGLCPRETTAEPSLEQPLLAFVRRERDRTQFAMETHREPDSVLAELLEAALDDEHGRAAIARVEKNA
jgi:hypothetical protein